MTDTKPDADEIERAKSHHAVDAETSRLPHTPVFGEVWCNLFKRANRDRTTLLCAFDTATEQRTGILEALKESADKLEAAWAECDALRAENEQLRREVREWICSRCMYVYSGPPQPGFKCVVCPRCEGSTDANGRPTEGTTMPRSRYELDRMRAEERSANERAAQLAIERYQWAQAIRSVASGCIPSPVAAETAIRELKEMHDKRSCQLAAAQKELREANETIETYEQVCHESLPKCVGAWVSGSGGHGKHAGGCDRVATWWQEDDCYAYCDKHKEAHDRYKEVSWAGLVRLIAELEG